MYILTDAALVTSATDLTLASDCEFGFLRVLDHRLGWSTEPLPDDDVMLKRAADLGNVHEGRLLQRYRAEHGDNLVEFEKPDGRSAEVLRDFADRTRDAPTQGAPVVYQGVFFDESDPSYRSSDTPTFSCANRMAATASSTQNSPDTCA